MANPATVSSGTTGQTAGGGEAVIYQTNALGSYVCSIDLTLMASGDVVELRAYTMVKTGGTATVIYQMAYYGAQPTDDCVKKFQEIETTLTGDTNPLKWTINQTFGVSRAFPYNVQQYS
jgi:hypothetical protein